MRYSKSDVEQSLANLREWLKPGDTVYTILRSVSRSGMSRRIQVVIPYTEQRPCDCHTYPPAAPHFIGPPRVDFLHPNFAVAAVLGLPLNDTGIAMGGCGMDMGFALVYELSSKVFPTYRCLGQREDGRALCPSNYHVNHHETIICPGEGSSDDRQHCYSIDGFLRRHGKDEEYPNWPRRIVRIEADEHSPAMELPAGYLSCIGDYGSPDFHVCGTCRGAGRIPNPEGPERWDLEHTDGYALKQRWL